MINQGTAAPGKSPGSDTTDPLIDRFLDAAWMERGLSANTLAAYRADLLALSRWLAQRSKTLVQTRRQDLMAFIAARVEADACASVDCCCKV